MIKMENWKGFASSKRLSTGPDTFELKDFKLDAKSAKQERVRISKYRLIIKRFHKIRNPLIAFFQLLDRATAIKTDKVESEKILQTSSNKSKKKKSPC